MREPNFLTRHAYWYITDFSAKCKKCETINTMTLENGNLKISVNINERDYDIRKKRN
jgi:hypothetical protein